MPSFLCGGIGNVTLTHLVSLKVELEVRVVEMA